MAHYPPAVSPSPARFPSLGAVPTVCPALPCPLLCPALLCSVFPALAPALQPAARTAPQRTAKQSKPMVHGAAPDCCTPTPSWFGLSLPLSCCCPLFTLFFLFSQPPSPVFNGWSFHHPWVSVLDDIPSAIRVHDLFHISPLSASLESLCPPTAHLVSSSRFVRRNLESALVNRLPPSLLQHKLNR